MPDWTAALGGGLLLVLVGVLPPAAAIDQLTAAWNVFLFFLGLGLAAATADRAGVFRAAAAAVAAAVEAGLIVLFASRRARAASGPGSVGHTARFVLGHAPCPVLLVRGSQPS